MEEARVVLKWLQSTDDDSKIENEIINFEESKTCKGKILLTGTKRKLSMFFKNIVFCCKNLQVSLIEKPLLKPIKERKTRKSQSCLARLSLI